MDHLSQPGASQAGYDPGEPAPHEPRSHRCAGHGWRRVRTWMQANTFAPSWLPVRLRHPAFIYLAAVFLEVVAVALTLLLASVPGFSVNTVLVILGVVLVALT